ncbi:glycosyltransferase family 2 protein [Nocardioides marmotae]|uniref:glycosyltransferase family 2 protein n=1 Tax=Nocardioides marmotae TaxID=2663857 RepID=UPI0012B521E7|nr:glycosyltransferase family 2 protein [Nocardioides marmotae]MBC9735431.1 glycosyltransferase family 2 protein [Nocardioides marmotae]MTB86528.1 glycosyltransferase [Nocardioides marmotae]
MSAPERVVALLVSHDGARWLPAVLDGLRGQTRPVDAVVAIDTGSKDDSADLVGSALGDLLVGGVERVTGATSYPAAVRLGLERAPDADWVWLLHDDSNPDPGALEALLAAAAADPEADVLGPKLREWPSLRRLLELGVTISGTGRRETGLERGEYDQGQHDAVRTVLAVNTAGMLVRRSVLEELDGFDPQLPIFGNDVDFGWRAAAAGHRTIVVPDAVVFHAEAAHRGLRRTPLTGRHTHYQERRAALYTLLANSRARSLPFQLVRLALGTVLRVIGFLLVRSVGEALDELAALVSIYSSPREVHAARRERQRRQVREPADVRRLLAPPWLPYRHGLDFVSDLATAATHQAADVAERRRAARAEHDPSSMAARRIELDEDEEYADTGAVARFLTNPVAVALAVLVVALLLGAGAAYGSVAGGGLSPVPASVGDWWRLHLEHWHPLGQGTGVPAPAYLLPLALLGSVLGTAGAVSAVLVLAAPVALWGAWRLLRVVGRFVSPQGAPRWLLLWGSATWSLVALTSGAWGEGRLGPVVATAVLPWLAHAALGFADPEPDRRWRAAWRTGVLLALTTAFTPAAWPFAVVLGVVVLAAAYAVVRSGLRERSVWGPPVVALAVPLVLLVPWWLPSLTEGAAAGLLLDAGRLPSPTVSPLDLLAGRIGDLGAPWWLGAAVVVLAVLALVPRPTRIPVLVCWIVAAVAAVCAAVLSTITLTLATVETAPALGVFVVLLQGAFVTAAVLGGQGAPRRVVAALVAVATVVPLGGLVWFLTAAENDLDADPGSAIPAYMVQAATRGDDHGILVIRGSVEDGLTWVVRRGDGVTLGEDEVLALSPEDRALTRDVQQLASRPTPALVTELADRGIEYVVLPAPADGSVASMLDATGGLVQASAADPATRAWQVDRPLSDDALDGPRSWLRIVLLVVQGVALVWVLVLCAPTTQRAIERRRR